MVKCNDYWCEHFDKNKGNCDKCLKKEESKDKPELNALLKGGVAKQRELGKKIRTNGQAR